MVSPNALSTSDKVTIGTSQNTTPTTTASTTDKTIVSPQQTTPTSPRQLQPGQTLQENAAKAGTHQALNISGQQTKGSTELGRQ